MPELLGGESRCPHCHGSEWVEAAGVVPCIECSVQASTYDRLVAERDRLRAALISIQAHGAITDNEQSMKWTARVALNPNALDGAPADLRDIIAARFGAVFSS